MLPEFSAIISLKAAHSLPTPCICTYLLPLLMPYHLTFDHLPSPCYTPVILNYLFQHRQPVLSSPTLTWTVLFGNSKSLVYQQAPCLWKLVCYQVHCPVRLGQPGTGFWGQKFLSYIIKTGQYLRMQCSTSMSPVMLPGTLPFFLSPGSHKDKETELSPVVKGIK